MSNSTNKEPLNLNLSVVLKRTFKAHCVMIGRDMSDVTEELYREFLLSEGVEIADAATKQLKADITRAGDIATNINTSKKKAAARSKARGPMKQAS